MSPDFRIAKGPQGIPRFCPAFEIHVTHPGFISKHKPSVRILFAFNYPSLDSKMSFPPTTAELLEAFEDIQEWDERYDYIIDLGRELPELPAELQTKENIVDGCMSTVWLVTEGSGADSPVSIQADSDSIIVKGLVVVMLSYFSGKTAAEIVQSDVSEYLAKLGLNQHLSPQRRNGLFAMVKRLKGLATEIAAG